MSEDTKQSNEIKELKLFSITLNGMNECHTEMSTNGSKLERLINRQTQLIACQRTAFQMLIEAVISDNNFLKERLYQQSKSTPQ